MAHASMYFTVGAADRHDVKAIKRELDTLPGVMSVSVSERDGRVAVDYDTSGVKAEQLNCKVESLGYQPSDQVIHQLTT